jgi:hypothetical protein
MKQSAGGADFPLKGCNHVQSCENLFGSNGGLMTSTGNRSWGSLYMALTARAAGFAINELKKQNL